jgi:hypothetical protein
LLGGAAGLVVAGTYIGYNNCIHSELNPAGAAGSRCIILFGAYTFQLATGYTGDVDAAGWPRGKGMTTFPWARYEGDFVQGKLTDKRVLAFADGGRYEGGFMEGEPHGQGGRTWPGGGTYAGD